MRKIKKINGYLVVRFNERELRDWADTALGAYGVIDAELYTGCLDIDRSVMEYDNAGSLDEAIELARGLESEIDVTEPETCYTVLKETDDDSDIMAVDPPAMISEREEVLTYQIGNRHFPNITPETARHELYGYMVALLELGMITDEECFVEPDHFEPDKITVTQPLPYKPEDIIAERRRWVKRTETKKAQRGPEVESALHLDSYEQMGTAEFDKRFSLQRANDLLAQIERLRHLDAHDDPELQIAFSKAIFDAYNAFNQIIYSR